MHPLGTALNHFATAEFRFHYRQLTPENRSIADRCFQLLQADPRHPSLRLKKVGAFSSARGGLRIRAWQEMAPRGWCGFGSALTIDMSS